MRPQYIPTPQRRKQIVATLKATGNAEQAIKELGGAYHKIIRGIAKDEKIPLVNNRRTQVSANKRRQILAVLKANPDASPEQIVRTVGDVSVLMVENVIRVKNSGFLQEKKILLAGANRNMPTREFRRELRALIQKFDDRPKGAG